MGCCRDIADRGRGAQRDIRILSSGKGRHLQRIDAGKHTHTGPAERRQQGEPERDKRQLPDIRYRLPDKGEYQADPHLLLPGKGEVGSKRKRIQGGRCKTDGCEANPHTTARIREHRGRRGILQLRCNRGIRTAVRHAGDFGRPDYHQRDRSNTDFQRFC